MTTTARLGIALLLAAAAAASGCRTRNPRGASAATPAAAAGGAQVFVEASVLRVDRAAVEALLGEARPGAASVRTLSVADADAFLARLRALPGADEVAAPRILALDGQEAVVFVGETAPGPGDLRFEAEERALSRPGSSGFVLRVVPRTAGASGRVAADVRFAWKDAEGEATGPVTRQSTRLLSAPDERVVWTFPVASPRPSARDVFVVVLSTRVLEV
jgi:hypothetical protein